MSAAMQEEWSCDVKKSEGLQEEIQKRFMDNRRHLTKARNPISLNYLAFNSKSRGNRIRTELLTVKGPKTGITTCLTPNKKMVMVVVVVAFW